ncbi:site-specific integrase [Emcibacter sp. SYSU 3D8]|uniref:site-specific integrase n=1 Tax=Emcibacter sp. SYSU 3D8 TaxID=3133969 RepID=UPI0031FF1764
MPKVMINDLVNGWLRLRLDEDLQARSSRTAGYLDGARELDLPVGHYINIGIGLDATDELARMAHILRDADLHAMQTSMSGEITALGVTAEQGTPQYIKLAQALFAASQRLREVQVERSDGRTINASRLDLVEFQEEEIEISGGASAPAAAAASGAVELSPPSQMVDEEAALSTVRDRYIAEMRATQSLRIKAMDTHLTATSLLVEVLGNDALLQSITPAMLGRFKQVVLSLPSNRTKKLPGLGYAEAIRVAAERGLPKLDNGTAKGKYLIPMKLFFRWCKESGLLGINPAEGINHRAPKKTTKPRSPFDASELQILFDAPLFRGCRSSGRVTEPGNFQVRDHRFWMPLIALFTGARLGEICQLRVADIVTEEGVPCFDINDAGDKNLKTAASKRLTPIHRELLDIGFLDYVAQRRRSGSALLWPAVKKGASGYESDPESKRLNRLLGQILGEDLRRRRSLSFHSFRHTMIDALRAADVGEDVRHAVVGHEGTHVEQQHYGKGYGPQSLLKAVNAVNYPIDLTGLYPGT